MKIIYNYIEKGELKKNAHHSYNENELGIIEIIKRDDKKILAKVQKIGNTYFIEPNTKKLADEITKYIVENYLDMLKDNTKFVVNGLQIFNTNLSRVKQIIYNTE